MGVERAQGMTIPRKRQEILLCMALQTTKEGSHRVVLPIASRPRMPYVLVIPSDKHPSP